MKPNVALAALLLFEAGSIAARAAEEGTGRSALVEWLAATFSAELRAAEGRIKELDAELSGLPSLRDGDRGSRYGYHSGTIAEVMKPEWVQIDLGKVSRIDGFAAMPARVATIEVEGDGYGFPLGFTIEVANHVKMAGATLVVDRSGGDVDKPGRYPMIFSTPEVSGRYVRFTSTKHAASGEGFFWAMDELLVMSGKSNLAVGCEVSASSQLELYPSWSVAGINDGLSDLGMPMTVAGSPTNGYLSDSSDPTGEEKWLAVDFGESMEIDEILLFPAGSEKNVNPKGVPRTGARLFPQDLSVELSDDREFVNPVWRSDLDSLPRGFPWACPVAFRTGGVKGRYARVVARRNWSRGRDGHRFALAELQVFSGEENIALGKDVWAKDAVDRPGPSRWAPAFAVDGFTSRHPIAELPGYLSLVARRGELEKEKGMLLALRADKTTQASVVLRGGGLGLGALGLTGWLWVLARRKAVRRRDAESLRQQIASDLHDDIGSNLGGIVLLSEMGMRHGGCDEQARGDFGAIKSTAEETVESMGDIVWLIAPGSARLRELLVKMRKSVEMIVGALVVKVVVTPVDYRDRELSLLFRRHFLFAFKEALNNVRKHSAATTVEVGIAVGAGSLSFEIADDGGGFDPAAVPVEGRGLGNLERRADRLNGSCRLESAPGRGTTVFFEVPFGA